MPLCATSALQSAQHRPGGGGGGREGGRRQTLLDGTAGLRLVCYKETSAVGIEPFSLSPSPTPTPSPSAPFPWTHLSVMVSRQLQLRLRPAHQPVHQHHKSTLSFFPLGISHLSSGVSNTQWVPGASPSPPPLPRPPPSPPLLDPIDQVLSHPPLCRGLQAVAAAAQACSPASA